MTMRVLCCARPVESHILPTFSLPLYPRWRGALERSASQSSARDGAAGCGMQSPSVFSIIPCTRGEDISWRGV
jgi:hypothetical protein